MVTRSAQPDPATSRPKRRVRAVLAVVGALLIVLIGVTLGLAFFNWNLLRGVIGSQASRMAGRTISLNGDLQVHLLSLTPGLTAADVRVGGSNGLPGDLARIGRFSVRVRLLPLLVGRVELPLVDFENPDISAFKAVNGQTNWRAAGGSRAPLKLPPIQDFVVNNGHFHLVDQTRRLVLSAALQSSETPAAAGDKGAFRLQGRGLLNQRPFALTLTGGALLHVKPDQPYGFDADLSAGDTHVLAHGVLPHPFDLGQVTTALVVSGADLADLYPLIGVALPNTPSYRLTGDLVRKGRTYAFTHVLGLVGHSDLEGAFQVDHQGDRPDLHADLQSRALTLTDLGAAVGAPSQGARGSPTQLAERERLQSQDRLLPDATLDVARLRSTDADVRYSAASVIAGPHLPLRRVSFHLVLDNGVMKIDPLAVDFPYGRLTGQVRLDARGATPKDDVDLSMSNVHVEEFFPGPGPAPLSGVLQARARLSGEGASVRQVAATANGTVTLVEPEGRVRQSLAELLGIDVTKGLGLLLAKNQSDMPVRCAVADFQATDGILTARNLLFDTQTVLATGKGTINLRDETLDLTLKGQPKQFRLVRLSAPISLEGRLRSPKLGVKLGSAALQAGAGAALAVLATPLVAVLPFVDPGLAHNADCAAAEQDAEAKGAMPAFARGAARSHSKTTSTAMKTAHE